jgi:excisionase family DNA binding protein
MDVMTVQEAAAVLGIEGSVIRRRLIAGTMKGHKVNDRLWLIPKREVEKWRKMAPIPKGRKPTRRPPPGEDA